MAVLTWNGLWPMPDTDFPPASAVYQAVHPRLAVPVGPQASQWLYATGGSGSGATAFPVIPQFTKYPVSP